MIYLFEGLFSMTQIFSEGLVFKKYQQLVKAFVASYTGPGAYTQGDWRNS